MTFEAGVRRVAPDTRPLPDSDPVLVDLLREELSATGPITFARYMEVALTEPGHGYYVTSTDRPTRQGDFVTAPELHPIFGAVLARALDEGWRALDRPDPYVLVEYGAGTGALAESILTGLRADGSGLREALRYEPIELTADHAERIRARLAAVGFADAMAAPEPTDSAADHSRSADIQAAADIPPATGTVLANEYLDALPVHRVERSAGVLRELFVTWDPVGGRFAEIAGPPSTPALADRLASEGVQLPEGARAEICLAIDEWLDDASARVGRGFGLVIDYGRRAGELYGPARAGGTLRAYSGQRAHDDPFVAIGRQDLTAHVDFSGVERAAADRGWHSLGLTTQARFLVGAGLEGILRARQVDPDLGPTGYLALRASVMRLIDPRALGAFRVLALGRRVPPETRLSGVVDEGNADPPPTGPP
ncbi:MAG: class I SAM-dependent methyltransferase [Candidatus Limnocylindrales bacterium]